MFGGVRVFQGFRRVYLLLTFSASKTTERTDGSARRADRPGSAFAASLIPDEVDPEPETGCFFDRNIKKQFPFECFWVDAAWRLRAAWKAVEPEAVVSVLRQRSCSWSSRKIVVLKPSPVVLTSVQFVGFTLCFQVNVTIWTFRLCFPIILMLIICPTVLPLYKWSLWCVNMWPD